MPYIENMKNAKAIQDDLRKVKSIERQLEVIYHAVQKMENDLKKYGKLQKKYAQDMDRLADFFPYLESAISNLGNESTAEMSDVFYEMVQLFASYGSRVNYADSVNTELDYCPDIADAFVEDSVLYVRVPMLAKRVIRPANSSGAWQMEGNNFYRRELKAALARVEHLIPWDENRTLNYVFVYAPNRVGLDSDSHDTKAITDTICEMYRGSDDNRYCSFTYEALHTSEVKEGTYIAVAPQKAFHISAWESINKWIAHDAKNVPETGWKEQAPSL